MRKSARELLFLFSVPLLTVLSTSSLVAQSSSVELIGTVTANQVSQGLGFNLDPDQDWEWAAAAAAGATHARIQCNWSTVEQQTAPPNNTAASTQYVQDPACASGLASAAKYGIHPTVVAAYGPPFHQILTVTVPAGATVGATSLDVEFQAGVGGDTLKNLSFPNDYVCPADAASLAQLGAAAVCSGQMSGRHSYEGTLITGITLKDSTHATLTLASAITSTLPAGTSPFIVNEILYPAAATDSATDSSVVAYTNYVSFLANDMAARGVTGDIEIWNEPPWPQDPWDFRAYLYDSGSYTGTSEYGADFGFAANLMKRTFPTGITATWNGTSGSSSGSLLSSHMLRYSGETLVEPSTTVTAESLHPYSGHYANPEDSMFVSSCLQAEAASGGGSNCQLPGEAGTSNYWQQKLWSLQQQTINPSYGLGAEVTETNELPPAAGLQTQQARAILRQFIGFQADGITPVEFFKLYFAGMTDPTFSFVQEVDSSGDYTANPAYTAISGLMSDIAPISTAPVTAYSASSLPSVASYSGQYALGSAHMVGARSGASANSDAFFVWQLTACTTTATCWYTLSSPAAAPITVTIPSGMSVTSVTNLTQRTGVTYTQSGQQISFSVTDDPIEIIVDPIALDIAATTVASQPGLTLSASPTSTSYGSQVVLTATLSPYSTAKSTNNETIIFSVGTSLLGTAPLSSGVATLNITTLPVGTDVLQASYAGDKYFSAASAITTLPVSLASPQLTFSGISSQVPDTSKITVSTTSLSGVTPNYTVVSGPARIISGSGQSFLLGFFGPGTVVLQATQSASGNYTAQTVQTTFNVTTAPSLAFSAIGNQTFGIAPFSIAATSNSTGAITYSVVSGPAAVSGSTVTLTGLGTVVLQASQVAEGAYTAATAQTSFSVAGESPNLTLASIASQTYGASPFRIGASSLSSGSITYSVLNGPATIAGSTVTVTGTGYVTVQANQAASGNFATDVTQQIFFVAQASPNLTFSALPSQIPYSTPITVGTTSLSGLWPNFLVVSGPARIISGSGQSVVIAFFGPGTVVLQATIGATGDYTAQTVQTSFTVADTSTSALSFAPLGTQTYGETPFTVSASSGSTSAITYSKVSGPASLTGSTVTLTGVGTVVLKASQPLAGSANVLTAMTSFSVLGASPQLAIASIANQVYGSASFPVGATSRSSGTITYSVASGPASVTGNIVSLTGVGAVVLQANQVAAGNYAAASTITNFSVSNKTTALSLSSISSQSYGTAPFIVSAKSNSAAPTTYSILSGPAAVSGDLVSLTGVGSVTVLASQPALGLFSAASSQTTFTVLGESPGSKFNKIYNPSLSAKTFTATITSLNPSMPTYTVVSGPAKISSTTNNSITLLLLGEGTVKIKAVQAAYGNFTSASCHTTFDVIP